MVKITANKEVVWRGDFDEFGNVNVQKVTQITDDEGNVTERYWRAGVTLDDEYPEGAPTHVRGIIKANRTPEAVARHEARKAARLPG